jgi:hypothetical protein
MRECCNGPNTLLIGREEAQERAAIGVYILDFGLAKLHELDALDVQTEVTLIRQVAARWDTSSQFYETFFVGWHIEFAVCLLQASA